MYVETIEDFTRKYQGCFLYITINGRAILARYQDANEDGNLVFTTNEVGQVLLRRENVFTNVHFIFPDRGMYNINGQAVLFSRVAARQWKRAPCKANCGFFTVMNRSELEQPLLSFGTVEQLFLPEYPSLEKAITLLKTRFNVAITKNISISNTPTNDYDVIIWWNLRPIATVKDNLITCIDLDFQEELIDFINLHKEPWKLKKN